MNWTAWNASLLSEEQCRLSLRYEKLLQKFEEMKMENKQLKKQLKKQKSVLQNRAGLNAEDVDADDSYIVKAKSGLNVKSKSGLHLGKVSKIDPILEWNDAVENMRRRVLNSEPDDASDDDSLDELEFSMPMHLNTLRSLEMNGEQNSLANWRRRQHNGIKMPIPYGTRLGSAAARKVFSGFARISRPQNAYNFTATQDEDLRQALWGLKGNYVENIEAVWETGAPVKNKSPLQCRARWIELQNVHHWTKRKWLPVEDDMLSNIVHSRGAGNWHLLACYVPGRNFKQCRERWHNHLDPAVHKSKKTATNGTDNHHLTNNHWFSNSASRTVGQNSARQLRSLRPKEKSTD